MQGSQLVPDTCYGLLFLPLAVLEWVYMSLVHWERIRLIQDACIVMVQGRQDFKGTSPLCIGRG